MELLFILIGLGWLLLRGSRETQSAAYHIQRDLQRGINRRKAARYRR